MNKMQSARKLIVIGAGPIGIETALYAVKAGYDVMVLEKGDLGQNINLWRHVRFFSPFGLNHSVIGRKVLEVQGLRIPENHELLKGEEYLRRYLMPLGQSPLLNARIFTNCKVVSIGRQRLFKGDHIGDGQRQNYPFRVLAERENGDEILYFADYVIDASGSYCNHNWLGDGGIPAVGERAHADMISYTLEDIADSARHHYLGKTTLVVGAGHSAATTIAAFESLFEEDSYTKVVWLTRSKGEYPLQSIENDRLSERARIVENANHLSRHENIQWIPDAVVNGVRFDRKTHRFIVDIAIQSGDKQIFVDKVIANVGTKPDNSIYRELQVHECYASCGPMKLAAALLGDASADCLTQPSKGPEVLLNPEPNFFIIGVKSYGKNSNFLLKVGFEQIRDCFKLITGDGELDYYSLEAKSLAG